MIKKENRDDSNTRISSQPYTVNLDNSNYILKKEVLVRNVEEKILRMKRWYSPKLKILSFLNGKLELKCTHQNSSENLTVLIEKDKLRISCSCNTEPKCYVFMPTKYWTI